MTEKCFIKFPGGKSRLSKKIVDIFPVADKLYDVFCGGGSISIEYARRNRTAKIVMNDLDKYVYSMWDVIINGTDNDLGELITLIRQRPTIELFNYNRKIQKTNLSKIELAYQCIFFHKTTFSGMFNAGPIGGINQQSKWKIDCHYNANNIINKIIDVRKLLKNRTTVTNLDFRNITFTDSYIAYFDPPYVTVGNKLYPISFNDKDHVDLSNKLHSMNNWILSYNDHALIRQLYSNCDIIVIDHNISMTSFNKSGKCSKKQELIISPKPNNTLYNIFSIKNKIFNYPPDKMLDAIRKFTYKVSKVKINKNIYTEQHCLPLVNNQHIQGKIAEYAIWRLLKQYNCSNFSLYNRPSWTDFTMEGYNIHVKSTNFENTIKYKESYTFQCNYKTGRVDPLFSRMDSDKDIIICCFVDDYNKKVVVNHIFIWKYISEYVINDYRIDNYSTRGDKKFLHIDSLATDKLKDIKEKSCQNIC